MIKHDQLHLNDDAPHVRRAINHPKEEKLTRATRATEKGTWHSIALRGRIGVTGATGMGTRAKHATFRTSAGRMFPRTGLHGQHGLKAPRRRRSARYGGVPYVLEMEGKQDQATWGDGVHYVTSQTNHLILQQLHQAISLLFTFLNLMPHLHTTGHCASRRAR